MTKTVDEVRSEMDVLYASGKAYQSALVFDAIRGNQIRATSLHLSTPFAQDPTARILDIGCGEGGITAFFPHRNVIGIDISPVAIERARHNFPTGHFEASAIEVLAQASWYDGPFDLVVAQESIEHWTNAEQGLRVVASVLKPGGWFVLTTPNRDSLHCRMSRKFKREAPYCSNDHIHEFGYTELIDAVRKHGFRHDKACGVHLAPYWSMEQELGDKIRSITDNDEEVNVWLNEIGRSCPEYSFIQCHRFVREP